MNAPLRPTLLLSLFALLLLTGCAQPPRVAVDRAAWTERTDEAAVMAIDVEVSNPGRAPVELREMRYRVSLDGRRVYEGRRSAAQTIAPGDSVQLSVPAVVRAEDLRSGGEISIVGSVGFITPGRVALVMRDLGLPPLRSDFSGESRVTAP